MNKGIANDLLSKLTDDETDLKIEAIAYNIAVLTDFVIDKLPTVINEQFYAIQRQIDSIRQKLDTMCSPQYLQTKMTGTPPLPGQQYIQTPTNAPLTLGQANLPPGYIPPKPAKPQTRPTSLKDMLQNESKSKN